MDRTPSEEVERAQDDAPQTKTRAWIRQRSAYLCQDSVAVKILDRTEDEGDGKYQNRPPRSEIQYAKDRWTQTQRPTPIAAGVRFNRDLKEILKGHSQVRTITFPKTVRAVKFEAFSGQKTLLSAVLNEGLETLGSNGRQRYDSESHYVFQSSGLQKVHLPSTLKEIGRSAFEYCTGLKNVRFPDKLERIGTNAFAGSGLEEVALPPSTKTVDPGAFRLCRTLRHAQLNEGLETLGSITKGEVFQGCALENVKIPSTVKKVGEDTFDNCKRLKTIVLADGLSAIESLWRTTIEHITLPHTLKLVAPNTFWGCEKLQTITVEDGCDACLYQAEVPETSRVGPPPAKTQRVWSLRSLKHVVIPNGVKRIGNHWFWRCHVEKVMIPASVTEIGTEAFCKCRMLSGIVFEEYRLGTRSRLEVIGRGAFCGCVGLKEVKFPNYLEEIGTDAFRDSGLTNIKLSSRVRVIRQGAFQRCESLRQAVLNEGLEVLGTAEYPSERESFRRNYGVFAESALEKVTLPSTLRRIERSAFEGCRHL